MVNPYTKDQHRMRHSAIAAALDSTGGDVRRVQKLSRNADLCTLQINDDNRDDHQGQVTSLLLVVLHVSSQSVT